MTTEQPLPSTEKQQPKTKVSVSKEPMTVIKVAHKMIASKATLKDAVEKLTVATKMLEVKVSKVPVATSNANKSEGVPPVSVLTEPLVAITAGEKSLAADENKPAAISTSEGRVAKKPSAASRSREKPFTDKNPVTVSVSEAHVIANEKPPAASTSEVKPDKEQSAVSTSEAKVSAAEKEPVLAREASPAKKASVAPKSPAKPIAKKLPAASSSEDKSLTVTAPQSAGLT